MVSRERYLSEGYGQLVAEEREGELNWAPYSLNESVGLEGESDTPAWIYVGVGSDVIVIDEHPGRDVRLAIYDEMADGSPLVDVAFTDFIELLRRYAAEGVDDAYVEIEMTWDPEGGSTTPSSSCSIKGVGEAEHPNDGLPTRSALERAGFRFDAEEMRWLEIPSVPVATPSPAHANPPAPTQPPKHHEASPPQPMAAHEKAVIESVPAPSPAAASPAVDKPRNKASSPTRPVASRAASSTSGWSLADLYTKVPTVAVVAVMALLVAVIESTSGQVPDTSTSSTSSTPSEHRAEGVDDKQATPVERHQNACESGDAKACYDLAGLYLNGSRRDRGLTPATTLWQKACDGGDVRGCYDLGVAYSTGYGVREDKELAANLWDKACQGGNEKGCYNLGIAHYKGDGVDQNETRAAQLLEKACKGGDESGCERFRELEDIRREKAKEEATYAEAKARLGELHKEARALKDKNNRLIEAHDSVVLKIAINSQPHEYDAIMADWEGARGRYNSKLSFEADQRGAWWADGRNRHESLHRGACGRDVACIEESYTRVIAFMKGWSPPAIPRKDSGMKKAGPNDDDSSPKGLGKKDPRKGAAYPASGMKKAGPNDNDSSPKGLGKKDPRKGAAYPASGMDKADIEKAPKGWREKKTDRKKRPKKRDSSFPRNIYGDEIR